MKTLARSPAGIHQSAPGLGYKMHDEGLLLPRFVGFMAEHHAEHITVRLALEWAQCASVQPRRGGPDGFASCVASPAIAAPPTAARRYLRSAYCHTDPRARPYLYTEDEISRLLDAALELPVAWPSTPLRPWVFHGLIGLLSVTGMRLRSAESQAFADVDLKQAVLTIRGAKFGQWRLVPIHPSTNAILADYIERRTLFFHHPISTYLFVTRRGNRLDSGHVHRTFYTLSRSTGLRASVQTKGPRLHDFRHNFAVQTLKRWYQTNKEPGREMPLLSTYLGHVCVSGTYWYLSGNPELMAEAMTRLERRWESRHERPA